jgi:stearoyl-CoA desaturase (delta-9 desaturase)
MEDNQATIPTNPMMERINGFVFYGINIISVIALPFVIYYWRETDWRSVKIAVIRYVVSMFLITGVYHRYFSHRSYKTSRVFQFILAALTTGCLQKGPVWWAAHHRKHHKLSDKPGDPHSKKLLGFWESHFNWVASGKHSATELKWVKMDWGDRRKYPELFWLGKFHWVVPVLYTVFCCLYAGWSGLFIGMGLSTVVFWHATFTINSISHMWGWKRYETGEESKNNPVLALLTFGEGWHNNHHHYQNSANQGFYWWEIDITYWGLKALECAGLIWDLHRPPGHILAKSRIP